MNLWQETMRALKSNDKTFDDIIAICGDTFQISKEDFIRLANTEYDAGFGAQEVATDLKLIGFDFWLERFEYDGAENWVFKQMPDYQNLPTRNISALTIHQTNISFIGWGTLEDLNKEREE